MDEILARKLPEILDKARYAPSVHNTQPWRVSHEGAAVKITVDSSHQLRYGDPTGRQTTISLGIFCEAIKIAAESCGLQVVDIKQKSDGASLTLQENSHAPKKDLQYAELLRIRHTDRSVYRPAHIEPTVVQALTNAWKSSAVTIHVSTDRDLINTVADLTSKGMAVALSSPDFRQELSHCLVLLGSHKKRGISVRSLYLPIWLACMQPWMLRWGFNIQKEAALERKRWESASAVVLVTAKGDLSQYWFEAGRAYMQVSLAIAGSDLAQATSAAIVEASNYHEDIEEMLDTNQRLLSVIRIGRGSARHYYSPRLTSAELTSN